MLNKQALSALISVWQMISLLQALINFMTDYKTFFTLLVSWLELVREARGKNNCSCKQFAMTNKL